MLIKLEKFKTCDVPTLISWIPDKEFLLQWAGPAYTFPLTQDQLQSEINMISSENPKTLMFTARISDTNEIVGHIQLLGIDLVNSCACIGRVLVGNEKLRNKGIGIKMINGILAIAFQTLKLHRIYLGVFDFNKSAIACYEKAGFKIEGTARDFRKINDEYWSLINMSILEEEYKISN
ncbi:GNAT family N-acetyltransferase [Clostridium estertheticum]|uniref:GNAT family N-acetyltransferase n=1 Tax=Clostridium estertheticum TaxID=238834 RepID=UPI0013E98FBA|nr:GNAT family protein [Clostridium estertheticum]MBZ9689719.1 GNAT family N-acetyltransferase [Clostridium estertheticum]